MKTLITSTLIIVFFALSGYAQSESKEIKTVNKIEKDKINEGWPRDIQGLIDHLNSWDKEELDAYERPDAYLNYSTSGETNGWVSEHKRKLGVTIFWNKEKMQYELKKEKQ